MISNVEFIFMYFSAICVFSLEKCLFKLFAHFLNQVFFFCCYYANEVPYIFWILNPYQMYSLIFSHSIGYLLILLFLLLHRNFLFDLALLVFILLLLPLISSNVWPVSVFSLFFNSVKWPLGPQFMLQLFLHPSTKRWH